MPSQLGLKPSSGSAYGHGGYAEMPDLRRDAEGNLVILASALAEAGIDPGDDWTCALVDGRLTLAPDAPRKIYVEPTALCNLACATCIRNAWDEPMGRMPLASYKK